MSGAAAKPWAVRDGHVVLTVRLVPNAGRDRIDGIEELADGQSVLKARVAAAARDNAANTALTRLIAKSLDLPRGAVTLIAGQTHRVKRLQLAGAPDQLLARLQGLSQASS